MSLAKHQTRMIFAVLVAVAATGCDKIGQTNDGASPEEIKSRVNAMSLDDQVKLQMRSPAPADVKLGIIKDIYAKAGKPMPDDIAKQLGGGTAH